MSVVLIIAIWVLNIIGLYFLLRNPVRRLFGSIKNKIKSGYRKFKKFFKHNCPNCDCDNCNDIELNEIVPRCCICLEDITDDLKQTACSHCYHSDCIDEWVSRNHNCPLCRRTIIF